MPAAVSSITRQTVGRTVIVAITILGVIALGQLGAIGWLFCTRFRLTPAPMPNFKSSGANSSGLAQPKDFTDPFAEVSDSSTALAVGTSVPVGPTPPPAPPRPSPISPEVLTRPAVPTEPTAEDRMNEAIDIARTLRDRGDTYAAVTKLREAETFDPDHPAPKAELAITLEKMGFNEKASELWKRVYDLGEKAGVYYEAAKAKMEVSKSDALRAAQSGTNAPVPITPADNVGMGATSKMGFDPITRTDEHDAHSTQHFTLHIPIRAKARARIDPSFIVVKVLLYDIIEGRQLEVTKASVVKKWQNEPPYDWSERDTETLDVVYARAYPQQGEPIEDRKFYGYVATIYYKNALQDVHSDPPNLAQRVQIPRTLPEASP